MSHLLVTGATGFVGHALSRAALAGGHHVTGVVREVGRCIPGVEEWHDTSADFSGLAGDWPRHFQGRVPDCVVHLAARVHVMRDKALDPDAAFRETNVVGALRVAQAAHRCGVRRMVFVSSIKAIAESDGGRPLREGDAPRPQDAYGRSKLEAEQVLLRYGNETGFEVVIVRPPLVYGPNVRANFLSLLGVIARGVPLPLGAITARRSLVFVDNLADALLRCATASRAAGQTFHVTDGHDLSVAELARSLARQLHVPARLVPVPVGVLRLAGRVTGRSAQVDRLIGELRLDSSHICECLGWYPPHTVEHGLLETAAWYRATH